MSTSLIWRHLTLGTHRSWLPGDPRGFHTRHHKTHSSGDYRTPPPPGEHLGLQQRSAQSGTPITIPTQLRGTIGRAFIQHLDTPQLLAIAVAGQHLHALAKLPADTAQTRRIVGQAKRKSSRAARHALPGRIWAAGGSYLPIRDRSHHRNAFNYILSHANQGAWTWRFDETPSIPDAALRSASS
ncbi:MAG: hypothetical protein AAF823_09105 [Planctomycetota bacterium]